MPGWMELQRNWQKRPSDHQLQEARKKDSDRDITRAVEAAHVPAHLVPPGSPQAKLLCQLHAPPSQGQSCHRQKKSCVWARRVPSGVSNSLRPRGLWPASLLSGRGSPGKNTGACWPVFLPRPSRALCFPLPQPPTPLSPWCCQSPRGPSSCPASTPGPHGGKPKSPRAASGANPSGRPRCRAGNKTTAETQGQCD